MHTLYQQHNYLSCYIFEVERTCQQEVNRVTKRITKVMPKKPVVPVRKRVCAYTRVSSGKDAMLHSLSAQVSYYSSYIRKNPEWEYAGVYTDEALTGTKGNRQEFQRVASCNSI